MFVGIKQIWVFHFSKGKKGTNLCGWASAVRMGLETEVSDGGTMGRGWWADDGGWLPAAVSCEREVPVGWF
jgi:hypothetical protein